MNFRTEADDVQYQDDETEDPTARAITNGVGLSLDRRRGDEREQGELQEQADESVAQHCVILECRYGVDYLGRRCRGGTVGSGRVDEVLEL
jgi:hypothetical protein